MVDSLSSQYSDRLGWHGSDLFWRIFATVLGIFIAGAGAVAVYEPIMKGQVNYQTFYPFWLGLLMIFVGCCMIYGGLSKKTRLTPP